MSRQIKLRYAARCADCGAHLAVGSLARYYGRGRIYGLECHPHHPQRHTAAEVAQAERDGAEPGMIASMADPYGVYSRDGEKLGSTCGCEDYPCCGH